ncbi:MAG: hypothetical protein K2F67_08660, partial [Eubacterium sp.]|nr:hypothetical protein [Eubacterium sp.]
MTKRFTSFLTIVHPTFTTINNNPIKSQRKSKKPLTLSDLCVNMAIEGQRKSKSTKTFTSMFNIDFTFLTD